MTAASRIEHAVRIRSRPNVAGGLARSLALVTLPIGLAIPVAAVAEGHVERGRALAEHWCNSCHIVKRDEPGMEAEMPGPPFATFSGLTEARLGSFLEQPHPYMPQFDDFSDQDVAAIVAYVRSLEE